MREIEHYLRRMKDKEIEEKDDIKERLEEANQEVVRNYLKKLSVTDPSSRFMKNVEGKIEFSYNPQVTVNCKGFILANGVEQNVADGGHLKRQTEQTEENLVGLPEGLIWSYDAGYYKNGNLEYMEEKIIYGYVPDNSESKSRQPFDKNNISYDRGQDRWRYPAGKNFVYLGTHHDKQKRKGIRIYQGEAYRSFALSRKCTRQ